MKQRNMCLSEKAYTRVSAEAAKAGISKKAYLEKHILRHKGARFTDPEALQACILQIAALSEKTGELVRLMNQDPQARPEQIKDLIAAYRRIERLVLDLKAGRR